MIIFLVVDDGRTVMWTQVEDGWDCFINGEEQFDHGALTHNGVFTKLVHFMQHPDEIQPESR